MAALIETTFNNPDPEDCPLTFTELVALLNELVESHLVGSFLPYITGAGTPGVDDQDKVWHKVDANGRPLGTFVYYSGAWRKQYSGNIGEIVLYSGDPSVDFAATGGAGTVGGEWDGWQLCNGSNGSPNLSDKFIVAAKMDDLGIGYPTGGPWKTSVSGTTTQEGAGVHEVQLDATNSYQPAIAPITVGLASATGNAPTAGGGLYGSNLTYPINITPGSAEFVPPVIPTLPPWYALAYVQFRGYA